MLLTSVTNIAYVHVKRAASGPHSEASRQKVVLVHRKLRNQAKAMES